MKVKRRSERVLDFFREMIKLRTKNLKSKFFTGDFDSFTKTLPCKGLKFPVFHTKGRKMIVLDTGTLIGIMIALVTSITLVITTAIHNARLTRAVGEYRKAWIIAKQSSFIVCDDHKAGN